MGSSVQHEPWDVGQAMDVGAEEIQWFGTTQNSNPDPLEIQQQYLVGGLEHFSIILGISSSQLAFTPSNFSGWVRRAQPPTSNH